MSAKPRVGLVLTGGGARAAYQVGVLRALVRIRRECGADRSNPFAVLTGTSAGAINATALACGADDFDAAVRRLNRTWQHFHSAQVYRDDPIGVIRTGARWVSMMSVGWAMARWRWTKPRSLLDNEPLRELLTDLVPTERIPELIAAGHLHALAVTASSYTSGHHVTFYQAAQGQSPWSRSQRLAIPTSIELAHLMASSAIPFVFPATKLSTPEGVEWFGDGSMRQMAPVSPAVHLGAERVFVVGAGRAHEMTTVRRETASYPSPAQIAGHALSSIFLDALTADLERLARINQTLACVPDEVQGRMPLRRIEALVIQPSQPLDEIAARHLKALPHTVRGLLRGFGVSGHSGRVQGAALASYLLFEAPYTQALMELGREDTLARRDELIAFFGWRPAR